MRYYKIIGKFGLVKTNILNTKLRQVYLPDADIRKELYNGNLAKAMFMTACTIESYLRHIYIMEKSKNKQKILIKELVKYRNVNLSNIIRFCKDNKFFNNKDVRIINFMREVRNDIAHNHMLLYDQNLSKRICIKTIEETFPVLHRLHTISMEQEQERKRFLSHPLTYK
ncbi:Uncharacterised protein [uncultured archaeon]|nr:Uncharacterised protein [uncultured archaeon]